MVLVNAIVLVAFVLVTVCVVSLMAAVLLDHHFMGEHARPWWILLRNLWTNPPAERPALNIERGGSGYGTSWTHGRPTSPAKLTRRTVPITKDESIVTTGFTVVEIGEDVARVLNALEDRGYRLVLPQTQATLKPGEQ